MAAWPRSRHTSYQTPKDEIGGGRPLRLKPQADLEQLVLLACADVLLLVAREVVHLHLIFDRLSMSAMLSKWQCFVEVHLKSR